MLERGDSPIKYPEPQDTITFSRQDAVFLLRALSAVEGAWLVGNGTQTQHVAESYIDPAVELLSEKLK